VVVDESAEEVRTYQPILGQTLKDVAHGLQLVCIFLSHPIPPAGCLLVTIGSSTLASFLRKNHSFRHPTDGLDTEGRKYGSIPGPVQTQISMQSHTIAAASESDHSRMPKMWFTY
jgi:hypothetical protein